MSLLDSKDIELRLCAAEVIAMLCESMAKIFSSNEEGFELEDYENIVDIEGMYEKLQSKKNNEVLEVKKRFKQVVQFIQAGGSDSESVTEVVGNKRYEGWKAFNQINFIRELIGKGIAHHLSSNPQLKRLFRGTELLEEDEKQRAKSKKGRQQSIQQQRRNKTLQHNAEN